MWKKYQDTVYFIGAVVLLLYGLLKFIGVAVRAFDDILFVIILPGWILYSLYKKNYFSRK
jgi:uncharacterized membrane protein